MSQATHCYVVFDNLSSAILHTLRKKNKQTKKVTVIVGRFSLTKG